jgi:hypothetical protein
VSVDPPGLDASSQWWNIAPPPLFRDGPEAALAGPAWREQHDRHHNIVVAARSLPRLYAA